jgi:UV DNA damage endonuclease
VGAKALTLHGGGKRGGTEAALERLARGIESLDASARALLVLENDDRVFTPAELLPFCESADIPFVYDVHHHRCLADGMSAGEATERAIRTWHDREPWMHISSPKDGWGSANPRMHAAFIDPNDVPNEWQGRRMTIDVEAKDKERAVIAISEAMRGKWRR